MIELGPDDARRVALWRQGLLSANPTPAQAERAGARRQEAIVRSTVEHLGAVQIDTISVLARSHELIAYARHGAIRRSAIEAAYWSDAATFEYWSHAACILPMHTWPAMAHRRRYFARKGQRWHGLSKTAIVEVRQRIADDGPINTGHVGGAKKSGYWWDWSDAKVALEWLLDIGEVVVTQRVGFRRMYDLAERVVPKEYRTGAGSTEWNARTWVDDEGILGPTDDDGVRWLIAEAARTIGIGTDDDIADVHRLSKRDVHRFADELGLVRVQVRGWQNARGVHPPTFATQEALDWLAAGGSARHRTTLLSPFDSLIWHRPRMERLFGMVHRIEAYTPAHKRVLGYFAMPVLHRGKLIARVDPAREGKTLLAKTVTMESTSADAVEGTARAIAEAARWAGCDSTSVRQITPPVARHALGSALSHLS